MKSEVRVYVYSGVASALLLCGLVVYWGVKLSEGQAMLTQSIVRLERSVSADSFLSRAEFSSYIRTLRIMNPTMRIPTFGVDK